MLSILNIHWRKYVIKLKVSWEGLDGKLILMTIPVTAMMMIQIKTTTIKASNRI